jgi:hypothetical protein
MPVGGGTVGGTGVAVGGGTVAVEVAGVTVTDAAGRGGVTVAAGVTVTISTIGVGTGAAMPPEQATRVKTAPTSAMKPQRAAGEDMPKHSSKVDGMSEKRRLYRSLICGDSSFVIMPLKLPGIARNRRGSMCLSVGARSDWGALQA